MRLLCALACFWITATSVAAVWKNEMFGCQANLPDSAGWQPIEAPSSESSTVLVAVLHAQKGSAFGVNVLHDLPSTNLRDPATVAGIEKSLQSIGYQFMGKAMVNIGGREWLQYPVRASVNATTGVMRYTAANDQIYVVSLLRTGGLEAAQDPELQAVAASVRVIDLTPAKTVASTPATQPSTSSSAPAKSTSSESTTIPKSAEDSEKVAIGPIVLTKDQFRMALYGVGGLLALLILLKLIGGGSKPKTPNYR